MQYAAPVECDVPLASALQPRLVATAYFCDAYRAPLTPPPAGVVEIFFIIFGHHPQWIKHVLVLRNRLAKRCGLSVPTKADIMMPVRRQNYEVGDTIGPWPIFSVLTTNSLLAATTGTWTSDSRYFESLQEQAPAWSCRPFVSYTTGSEGFTFSSSFHSIGGVSNTSSAERCARAGCEARSLHAHCGAAAQAK